jgi:cytochrome c biogenesis protein CcmG, thiol:disulfide interchange protein DsbE
VSTIDNETKTRSAASTWMFLAALAALLCIYLAIKPWRPLNDGGKHPAVGRQLPGLELQPLTVGAECVSLAELKGKVTLLNFWGTWCGPCVQEFPHLVALGKELKGNGDFRLLLVSCGGGVDDTLDELRDNTHRFLAAQKSDLPCYSDQHGFTRRSLMMATGQQGFGYPTTVVLDRSGVIRGMWEGYSPSAVLEMRQIIDELLAK